MPASARWHMVAGMGDVIPMALWERMRLEAVRLLRDVADDLERAEDGRAAALLLRLPLAELARLRTDRALTLP